MNWQNFKHKFLGGLMRFMYGRNGMDHLAAVVFILGTVVSIIAQFSRLIWLFPVSYGFMFYSIFRVFSRNVYQRQKENRAFRNLLNRFTGWIRIYTGMFRERKSYKFFRCPQCKQWIKIPRGKGKLKITCTKCREKFSGKT